MADYQEYRRHVLHRRWRRTFSTVLAFLMLVLLCGVWVLWRQLYPTRRENKTPQVTLLEQTLPSTEWRTLSYTRQTSLTVQKLTDGITTAMDFRLASMPETQTAPVDLSYFDNAVFLGDSLTQGLQIYDTGLPNAHYCAYRGVGPSAVVNGTTCTRVDGVQEVPLDAMVSYAPESVYILLGTNVLTQDTDYTSFLNYYSLMLDRIRNLLPDADIYVQSITPVRPEVSADAKHAGMYAERFIRVNNDLAALAVEKGCYFLDLWEVLADENGDLKAEYAQPDGYHLLPAGYTAWVEYLRTHVAHNDIVNPTEEQVQTAEAGVQTESLPAAASIPA
ncbi:lipase [Faecalibacterium sp. An77]|uniref:GDSL-type esterase/lipase family protein n=1 Tax=unclassified Faecalibacterium TaxID=2646395 RepID=UPI000B36EA32|nr:MULTISPECIES: GDSL-type esterase/lipase family protein [unclassified Faecalibacterium]OUN39690.1 lipase [Faecalibacterium sp. An77]OUP29999.1 lipase [Faecalibacterium sp. An192]